MNKFQILNELQRCMANRQIEVGDIFSVSGFDMDLRYIVQYIGSEVIVADALPPYVAGYTQKTFRLSEPTDYGFRYISHRDEEKFSQELKNWVEDYNKNYGESSTM